MELQIEHGPETGHSIHNPFYSAATQPPIDAEWQLRRELADSLRDMIESLVSGNHDIATLQTINSAVREHTHRLQQSPHYDGRFGYHRAEPQRYPTIAGLYYELSPLIGQSNPLAVPLKIWVEGTTIHGEVKPGWQYEGPPGSLHGGFIAAIFDEFLGLGQRITGNSGFTGTLSVRYHNLTPLHIQLRLVGKVKSVEGRKKTLLAEMWAGEVLTASCEGLFIDVPVPKLGA